MTFLYKPKSVTHSLTICSALVTDSVKELSILCRASAVSTNKHYDFSSIINNYSTRPRSYVIRLRDERDRLFGCCFILNLAESPSFDNTLVKIPAERMFTSSLFYIHPVYRRQRFGQHLIQVSNDYACSLGYTHRCIHTVFNDSVKQYFDENLYDNALTIKNIKIVKLKG